MLYTDVLLSRLVGSLAAYKQSKPHLSLEGPSIMVNEPWAQLTVTRYFNS